MEIGSRHVSAILGLGFECVRAIFVIDGVITMGLIGCYVRDDDERARLVNCGRFLGLFFGFGVLANN